MTRGAGGIRYDTLAVLLNILPKKKKQLDLLCAARGINPPKGEDKPPSRPQEINLRFSTGILPSHFCKWSCKSSRS